MAARARALPLRTSIIAIAIIASLMLYGAGVLSGLYATKIAKEQTAQTLSSFEQKTTSDLELLRTGTEEQITSLNTYIRFLETNINTIQLEQEFLAAQNETCKLSQLPMEHMIEQLQFYRDRLPFRLEQYEKENDLSEEYVLLKEQYNALSIRTWVFARNQRLQCNTSIVTGLYLYSNTCSDCVKQGEELDELIRELASQEKNVLLFTVDANAREPMVRFLKTYYNITSVPAIIMNDQVYQGTLVPAQTLLEGIA